MYKFKLKKEVNSLSPMEMLINETIDKVAFKCTAHCYDKDTCTNFHKKKQQKLSKILQKTCLGLI